MLSLSPQKQVRDLLLVMGSAILVGLLLVVGLVFYYSPEKTFSAKNVILAPEVIKKLWDARNPTVRLESIEFFFQEPGALRMESKPLNLDMYSHFYKLILGDKSSVPQERFGVVAGRLVINSSYNRLFQEVLFSEDGDHYRVQLIGENPDVVEFYHPKIYSQVRDLFK